MRTHMQGAGSSAVRGRGVAQSWLFLAALGAAAWVVTVAQARGMGASPGTMGMALPAFAAMWAVMMAAMMLPALGPEAAGEVGGDNIASRAGTVLSFGAGFLLPWVAYGVLAFAALEGTGRLASSSPDVAKWLGVAIFAVAGVYQLTPWKLSALLHCRMRMRPHPAESVGSAFLAGAADGTVCVGCCWALMTILIAVGVMNVAAMVGLATVIFAEKVLTRPRLVAAISGIAFLALALVAAVHPSILHGLTTGGAQMRTHMGGSNMGGM